MPDSKVVATLIICLAVIASTTIYAKKDYFFNQKPVAQAQVVAESGTTTIPTVNDDWKKMLTSTVGTSEPIQIAGQNDSANQDDNTLTAQISKEFFSLYLQDKKNGVAIDANEAQAIADQTLNNVQTTGAAKQYAVTDIKISSDSSDSAMKIYAQALLAAIKSSSLHNNIDPVVVVDTATKSGKDSDLSGIDLVMGDYKSAITKILAITVPQKTVGYHMVYLNTLSRIIYDLQGMRQLLTDPVASYLGFTNYQKDLPALILTTKDMVANFPVSK